MQKSTTEEPAIDKREQSVVKPPVQASMGWWLVGGGVLASFLALFFFWPYQHADQLERSSLAVGLWRLILLEQEWIFCPLVPLLSGYLAWQRRSELMEHPLRGSAWALVALLISAVFFWMGYKADTRYLGFAAAQMFLAGAILWVGGMPWMRILLFPWLFFVFTWPMVPLEERLGFPLRMITSQVTTVVLNVIGVDTVRDGTSLLSASNPEAGLARGERFSLEVENPCSGLRSLFSLVMITALYAYLSLRNPWHRILLFLCAIPLAMAGNIVRMVMLALGSMWFGTEFAVGRPSSVGGDMEISTFHMLSGFAVFGVALAGMFAIAQLLEGRAIKGVGEGFSRTKGTLKTSELPPPPDVRTGLARGLPLVGFAGVLLFLCAITPVNQGLSEPGLKLALPVMVDQFYGQELTMSAQERAVFEEGVELVRRRYTDLQDRAIMGTIVMSGPITQSLHRPEVCLPGQGWQIAEQRRVTIRPPNDDPFEASLLRLFREVELRDGRRVRLRGYNVFWYAGYGISTPDYQQHIIITHRDAIFRNLRHRWSMASFFLEVAPDMLEEEPNPMQDVAAISLLTDFVGRIAPAIKVRVEPEGEAAQTAAVPGA